MLEISSGVLVPTEPAGHTISTLGVIKMYFTLQ